MAAFVVFNSLLYGVDLSAQAFHYGNMPIILKPQLRKVNFQIVIDIYFDSVRKRMDGRSSRVFHIVNKDSLFHRVYNPIFPHTGEAV